MRKFLLTAVLASAVAVGLSGCAVAPAGPTVTALPGAEKPLDVFQMEDLECRNYAWNMMGGDAAADRANQRAMGTAALGTAIGAAAGALLGAGPHRDHGAAVGTGAAVGMVAGSAIGSDSASADASRLQLLYDNAYAACMSSKGNSITLPQQQGSTHYGATIGTAAVIVGGSSDFRRPPRHHHRPGSGFGGPGGGPRPGPGPRPGGGPGPGPRPGGFR